MQAVFGDMISLAVIGAVIAGIMKLFQIATTLNEIKDLLTDIKRNTLDYAASAGASRPHSPESLLRAVGGEPVPSAVEAAQYEPER